MSIVSTHITPCNLNNTIGIPCQYCNSNKPDVIVFVKEATGIRSCKKHIVNAKNDAYVFCKEQKMIWIRKQLIQEQLRRSSLFIKRSDGTMQADWFFCPLNKTPSGEEMFNEYEKFIKVGEHWTVNVYRQESDDWLSLNTSWVAKTMTVKQILSTNPHVERLLQAVIMFVEEMFGQCADFSGVLVG